MIKSFFLIFFLLQFTNFSFSQTNEDLSKYLPRYEYKEKKEDSIKKKVIDKKITVDVTPTHHVNSKVDTMLGKLKTYNENFIYAQGFRVQLYSGTNMATASSIEGKVKAAMSNIEGSHSVYRNYSAPTWKVRAGDFIDRLHAYRLYHKLKKHFSNALIVPDSKVLIKKIK